MIRVLHRWPGLLALVIVTILTLSGAMLAVFPTVEHLSAPQATPWPVAGSMIAAPGTPLSNHQAVIRPEGARWICSTPG